MLRHARKWLLLTLITGIFGFTGLLRTTAVLAQSLFFICAGFCLLSLLFSLFEQESKPQRATEVGVEPSVLQVQAFVSTLEPSIQGLNRNSGAASPQGSAEQPAPPTALAA